MKLLTIALASLGMNAPAPDHKILVLAHRACWEGGAPEVSLAAIRACEAIKPDMIEIDVRQTRDGALILMHDETVDRMTDGKGKVADLTASQIRALHLRARDGGPDAPLTSERVPSLEEGLRAAKGKFTVNLHLYVSAEAEVAAVVRKLGMAGQVTTWVSGQPDKLASSPLRGTIDLIPIVKQCPIPPSEGCWPSVPSLTGYAPYRPAGFYIIPETSLSSEAAGHFLEQAAAAPRPAGARIMVSTLFDLDRLPPPALRTEWRRLIALGADIIMTDHPGALLDLLRETRIDRSRGR